MCYGGIGHRRVSGELEGACNSRHAYQQLDKRACQPGTLCFDSSVVGMPIVVTTGNKPSSDIGSALVSAMYSRSSELGLYQTYTSAYLFDTLVSGLAGAKDKEGKERCCLSLFP